MERAQDAVVAGGPARSARVAFRGRALRYIGYPVLLATVGGGVWLWFGLSTRIALEDAFITFRYARNLAEGLGFVYNPGERVLGTTTPLQTMLLAMFGATLGPDRIPLISEIVMPVFGIGAGLVAYSALLGLGTGRLGAAAGALLFYLHPMAITCSLGGMETPLVLFLMAVSLYFVSQRRAVAATVAIALLSLCRLDGLIWGGMVMSATLLSSYRRPLRQVIAFGAVVLPWVIFAYHYFGGPVPNTVLAKGVVRPGQQHLLLDPHHAQLSALWYISGTGFGAEHPLFVAWVGLLALGVYAASRASRWEILLVPVFPLVYAALMYLGRAPQVEWYLLPMVLCCLLVGGMGMGQLVLWSSTRPATKARRVLAVALICAVIGLIPLNLIRYVPEHSQRNRLRQENEWALRRGIGLWLAARTPDGATVAMEAIGYQGYFSRRTVIDMVGLVTPRVVAFRRSARENAIVFKRVCSELKPDYIILRSFEMDENRHFNGGKLFLADVDREGFLRGYREVRRFTAPHPELNPGNTHLTLFERRQFRDPASPWRNEDNASWTAPLGLDRIGRDVALSDEAVRREPHHGEEMEIQCHVQVGGRGGGAGWRGDSGVAVSAP